MTVVQFPISLNQRLRQWDATQFDLGKCVHDDCDNPAMFYLDHRSGKQPSIRFTTGEHALRAKQWREQPLEGGLDDGAERWPTPLVCGDCALGALAAVIADGS